MAIWLDNVVLKYSNNIFSYSLSKNSFARRSDARRGYLKKIHNPLILGLIGFYAGAAQNCLQILNEGVSHDLFADNDACGGSKLILMRDIFLFLYQAAKLDGDNPYIEEINDQYTAINKSFGEYSVVAIKPSTQLVADLIYTEPPDIDYDNIVGKRLFYIDLPENYLVIDDIAIKALFFDDRHFSAYSGYTDIENNRMRYLQYDVLDNHVITNFPESSYNNAFKVIYDLIKLIILYFESDQKLETSYSFIAPHEIAKLNHKKQSAKLKKFSLFKLAYIDRPNNTDSWHTSEKRNTWDLSKIISVKGHWRWQPYGEKKARRKLIWINEYLKGDGDLEIKIEMMNLR